MNIKVLIYRSPLNLFNSKTKDLEVDYSILKECKNNIRMIGDKASMISSSVINNNLNSIHQITNEINKLGDEINKIKISQEKNENENLLKNISNQASEISIRLSQLRNS